MRLLLAVSLLLATPASAGKQEDRLLAGRATGPAIRCLRYRDISQQTIVSANTVFFLARGKTYRSDLAPSCPSLRPGRALIVRSVSAEQCRGDVFNVYDPLSRVDWGNCNFGSFTPWEPAAK